MKKFISAEEMAKRIGISPAYARNLLREGKFNRLPPFYRTGASSYMFKPKDVDAWLQERRVDVYAEKRKQQKGE